MSTLVTPSLERRREEFYSGARTGKKCASGASLEWFACEYPERPRSLARTAYDPDACERCAMAFFAAAMVSPDATIRDNTRGGVVSPLAEVLRSDVDRGYFDSYIWKPRVERALTRMEGSER